MWFRSLAKLFSPRPCKQRPYRRQPTRSTRLLLEALEDRAVPSALVSTDKPDYAPGETVNIQATGFKAGESVAFQVYDITDGTVLGSWRVRDGGAGDLDHVVNGQIQTTWVVDASAANDALRLNATGLASGAFAQTFFTDAAPQFTFDFVAAEPTTYNHATGGGMYDNRDIGTDVTESLEGGDFVCGDIVSFFVAITVDSGVVGSQSTDFNVVFDSFSSGQQGIGYTEIVGVQVNSPDTGTVGDDGSVATLTNQTITGPLFTKPTEVQGTIHVTDLEAGEVVIVRIDVRIGCNDDAANATGNLQASLDATGGQQTIPLMNVGNVQPPPTVGNDSFDCVDVDQPYLINASDLLANDEPGATIVSVDSTSVKGGTVSYDAQTGIITYTGDPSFFGIDAFNYTVSNGSPDTTTATVSLDLNHAPVTVADTFNSAINTPTSGNVLTNDSDPDGDAITVTNAGTYTSASGTLVLNSDGSFTFTPANGFSGKFTFDYTIADPCGDNSSSALTINVAPGATDDSFDCKDLAGLVNSNQAFNFSTSLILANDQGSGLTVTSVNSPTSLGGTVSLNGTAITYTPPASFGPHAVDTFSYTVTDGNGGTSTATVSLELNHPPVANPDNFNIQLNTPVSSNVLTNDTDADNEPLVVTNPGTFTSASGTLVLNSDGSFTFTPAATFSGKFTFTYNVADDCGAASSAVLTINVAPKANNDSFECHTLVGLADSTKPVSIATSLLLTNDQGGGITVTSVSATSSLGGKVVLNGTTITYTPPASFGAHAVDTFTYTITDSNGGTSTATVSLTLNHPPKANADAFTIVQGTSLSGNVLTNDTDADHDILKVKNAGTFTTANGGKVVLNANGTFTYTPKSTFTGTDSFTYTVVDDCGATSTATVTIKVNAPTKKIFLTR